MRGTSDIDDVERIASGIDGWLSEIEGRRLYELARHVDPATCIVEIGSWQGKSTVWLAAGARAGLGAGVVAIDPHEASALHADGESTEQALRRNLELAGVTEGVEVVVATSEEAVVGWKRPIGLLWIDGDHSYESVRRDFLLWEGHVVERGVVALHDTVDWDGPRQVVSRYLKGSSQYIGLAYADTITHATRRSRPTASELLRKRLSIVERSLYEVRVRAYDENRFHFADVLDIVNRRGRRRRRDSSSRLPEDD